MITTFKSLLTKHLWDAAPAPRAVPSDERIYAIGDVHGRLDLLTDLLNQIDAEIRDFADIRTTIILLGDLIDRGPDSAAILSMLAERDFGSVSLRLILGNHEELMLRSLEHDQQAMPFWLRVGGRETILSYGVEQDLIDSGTYVDIAADLIPRVPAAHIAVLRSMVDQIRIGDYCFVHAGVRPGVALDRQKPEDMRWIRSEFLDFEGDMGAVIVHGHSISYTVEELDNRIGIDTGAYESGKLTALVLQGTSRRYLTAVGGDMPQTC